MRIIGHRISLELRHGMLVTGLTRLVEVADPVAFWEGFCPDCHEPLGGDRLNYCLPCRTHWVKVPGPVAV